MRSYSHFFDNTVELRDYGAYILGIDMELGGIDRFRGRSKSNFSTNSNTSDVPRAPDESEGQAEKLEGSLLQCSDPLFGNIRIHHRSRG